jgi:phosphoadenosine phosphosulfate reductase
MPDCTCQISPAEPCAADPKSACLRLDGTAVLTRAVRRDFAGRIAVVSSFGAESAVLLALVASIDRATPVLFVDTGQHFAETLAYRDALAEKLGLTDIRTVEPTARELVAQDPSAELWRFDPDACCRLRKVTPLERALGPFDAWVTGRKRHQALTRVSLPIVEQVDGKTKINPLAQWTAAEIEAEMQRQDLPRHSLSLEGYPSIGCAPCTRAVATGEDPRSGRWAGTGKTECGIHRPPPTGDIHGSLPTGGVRGLPRATA